MIRWILAVATVLPVSAQLPSIWFCPLDPLVRPEVGYGGSPQYMQLFTEAAAWPKSAGRVNVFKIYPQWATQASDADLRTQFADLRRRGIALALEWGMLDASDACGRGVEGFGGQATLDVLRRIRRLGGDLRYIAMDEPVYFGTVYNGPNACRWTPEQMAASAARNILALQAEFPDIGVGDIEPLTGEANLLEHYARGVDALQAAIGAPLAFLHADVAWWTGSWPNALDGMRRLAGARQLPFGVIYNGTGNEGSDAAWISAAESHMTDYEAQAPPPDHVIFQSWNANPRRLLPEDDPASFTWLINRYFRIRTRLAANLEDGSVSGILEAGGEPVSGAAIRVTALPQSGTGVESQYVVEGIVPSGANRVVFGARVNLECGGCSGSADFRLKQFQLQSGDNTISKDFSAGLAGWGVSDATAVAVEDGQLHVQAASGQSVMLNSAAVEFGHGGEPFSLTVTATVAPSSSGSGYFAVIFLAGRELGRTVVPIAPQPQPLGTCTTGDDGSFRLTLPALPDLDWMFRAVFDGDDLYWPAAIKAERAGVAACPCKTPLLGAYIAQ